MAEEKQGTKHRSEQERKNQILDCALDIFLEKGYSRTTMKDIMVATQLSKGAIYHYFTSKEDIFVSIIHGVGGRFEEEIESFRSDAQPFDFLRVFMYENLEYIVKLNRLNMVCHEMMESELVQSSLNSCLDMYKNAIADVVNNCPDRTKELSVEELTTAVFLMLEGLLSMAATSNTFDVHTEFEKVLKTIEVLTRR